MEAFEQKTVLITGAASGMGKLLTRAFVRLGCRVVAIDINETGLKKIKSEFTEFKDNFFIFTCDLSLKKDIKRVTHVIKNNVSYIDILINCAGVVSGKSFLECSEHEIERTFAINTLAPMWLAREFLPDMIKHKTGHLVHISSAAGMIGSAGIADYAASKFALFGFDESMRVELKKQKHKIYTTIVCPFYVDTGMFQGVRTRVPWLLPILKPEYVVKKILKAIVKKKKRLYMPRIVYSISFFRLLPVTLFDSLATLLGVHSSMDKFKGRNTD